MRVLKGRQIIDRYHVLLRKYSELSEETDKDLSTKEILKKMASSKLEERHINSIIDKPELSINRYIYYGIKLFCAEDIYIILTGHLKERKVRRVHCTVCSELTYKIFQVQESSVQNKGAKSVSLCPECYLAIFKNKC